MNVFQICANIDQRLGGASASTLGIFLALRKKHVETGIFALGESNDNQKKLGFLPRLSIEQLSDIYMTKRKKSSPYGHILNLAETRLLIQRIKESDIVISHQIYGFQSIYTFLIAKYLKRDYVVMPHGSLTSYDQSQHRIKKYLFNKIFLTKYLANASAILVASKMEKKQIEEKFQVSEIHVVGLGFPELEIYPSTQNIARVKRPEISILFMGRIAKKKRLDRTIEAFHIFQQHHPLSRLVIAGDGARKDKKKIVNLIAKLGLENVVEFRGWVSEETKRKVLEECDYFILNSEDENFAVIVPEVQQYGIPVLLSDAVAYSEIVKEFHSGVVISSIDPQAIAQGLHQLVLIDYAEISKNAYRCAESSRWDVVIKNWIVVLNQLISSDTSKMNSK